MITKYLNLCRENLLTYRWNFFVMLYKQSKNIFCFALKLKEEILGSYSQQGNWNKSNT